MPGDWRQWSTSRAISMGTSRRPLRRLTCPTWRRSSARRSRSRTRSRSSSRLSGTLSLQTGSARTYPAPEQRVIAGNSLIARYCEEDQEAWVVERNRENEAARARGESALVALRGSNPEAKWGDLPKAVRDDAKWSHDGLRFRLRIEIDDVGCGLDEALALSSFREGDRLLLARRWTVDGRLSPEAQWEFTPTVKQLPWSLRANLEDIEVEYRDSKAAAAWAVVTLNSAHGAGSQEPGYVWDTGGDYNRPLVPGTLYTLDEDPNAWTSAWAIGIAKGLVAGNHNTVHDILAKRTRPEPGWPRSRWPPNVDSSMAW